MKIWKYKDLFSIVWENPLEEYKLARKFFKFPKLKFSFYKQNTTKDFTNSKLFSFRSCSMLWKSKYDNLEYDHNPYIEVVLFNKWKIVLDFLSPDNDLNCEPICYWEGILSFMNHRYYNKDFGYAIKEKNEVECLYKAYRENIWDGRYTIIPYMNNMGWHTLHSIIQKHCKDSIANTIR